MDKKQLAKLRKKAEKMASEIRHHRCPEEPKPSLRCDRFDSDLEIMFEDGSKFVLLYAFAVKRGKFIDVYSEHCGYYRFLAASVFEIEKHPYPSQIRWKHPPPEE